jgi:hypothetical protein
LNAPRYATAPEANRTSPVMLINFEPCQKLYKLELKFMLIQDEQCILLSWYNTDSDQFQWLCTSLYFLLVLGVYLKYLALIWVMKSILCSGKKQLNI